MTVSPRRRILLTSLLVCSTAAIARSQPPAPEPSATSSAPAIGLDPVPGATVEPAGFPEPGPAAMPPCTCGDQRGIRRFFGKTKPCARHAMEHFIGFPQEFHEWPLGASLNANMRTMTANGRVSRMIFYHYDFIDGSDALNDRGQQKLAKIACLAATNFCPIVIERTAEYPALGEARRLTVLAAFSQGPFPIPPERVIVGPPIAAGLKGREIEVIYDSQLQQVIRGGTLGAQSDSSGGAQGFDGSGLSGAVPAAGVP